MSETQMRLNYDMLITTSTRADNTRQLSYMSF